MFISQATTSSNRSTLLKAFRFGIANLKKKRERWTDTFEVIGTILKQYFLV